MPLLVVGASVAEHRPEVGRKARRNLAPTSALRARCGSSFGFNGTTGCEGAAAGSGYAKVGNAKVAHSQSITMHLSVFSCRFEELVLPHPFCRLAVLNSSICNSCVAFFPRFAYFLWLAIGTDASLSAALRESYCCPAGLGSRRSLRAVGGSFPLDGQIDSPLLSASHSERSLRKGCSVVLSPPDSVRPLPSNPQQTPTSEQKSA